jgi:nicotinamide riboside kinase
MEKGTWESDEAKGVWTIEWGKAEPVLFIDTDQLRANIWSAYYQPLAQMMGWLPKIPRELTEDEKAIHRAIKHHRV